MHLRVGHVKVGYELGWDSLGRVPVGVGLKREDRAQLDPSSAEHGKVIPFFIHF